MLPFLTEENLRWKQKAHDIAERVVRPLARKYDALQEYPWEIKDALAEAGLLGVWIPKEYGGAGAGVLNLCLCVEELSRACGGVGVVYAVNALGSFPILLAGTDEQKRKYLPEIAAGRKLIAFGLCEKFAGSDAASLRARAEKTATGWRLNGEKKWTTNGGVAELYTVFAVTDPESQRSRVSAFIVEKSDPGFSIQKVEDKMGIRAVPVVELDFTDCEIPADRLLGGKTRHRLQAGDDDAGPRPPRRGGPGRGPRPGRPRIRRRLCEPAQAVRPVDRQLPDDPGHAGRHGHPGRGRALPGLRCRLAHR